MQVMPGTWSHLAPKLGVTSPWIVKDNIQAGIYYDARMWAIWKALRPLVERIAFTLASYNAGPRQHSEGPAPGGRRFEHEQLGPGRGEIALGHRQVLRRDVRIRGLYPASTSEYTLKYLVAEVGTFA